MRLSELSQPEFEYRLKQGDLLIELPPFVTRLRSDVARAIGDLRLMYADFELLPPDSFADFHIDVLREPGIRRWLKPMARFFHDGRPSFVPLPADHAFTMIEWGLNWCVASHAHQYMVIHAAVLERGGRAVVMPAPPGSGKSTLCAGLAHRGWRLLSDELALYDMEAGLLYGMARPINLKNKSISVIRAFAPDAVLTESVPDTAKGTVALMRPSLSSVTQVRTPAQPGWIVLPKFVPGHPASMERNDRSETLILMAEQSFNYHIHGERGFDAMVALVGCSSCYRFTYSDLDEADAAFTALASGGGG